tara:strand:- start:3123 stop:3506 length:384 start_codon:yes stop_codon:yes gene_type:complete
MSWRNILKNSKEQERIEEVVRRIENEFTPQDVIEQLEDFGFNMANKNYQSIDLKSKLLFPYDKIKKARYEEPDMEFDDSRGTVYLMLELANKRISNGMLLGFDEPFYAEISITLGNNGKNVVGSDYS